MCQIGLSKSILVSSLSSIFFTRIFYWKGDLFCVILPRSACSLYHSISVLLSLLQSVGSTFLSGRSALCVLFRLHGFPYFSSINYYSLFVFFPSEQPRRASPLLTSVATFLAFLPVCHFTYLTLSVRIDGNHTIIRLSDSRLNALLSGTQNFWNLHLEEHK